MKHLNNLQKLSKGEHSLKEVLEMAGLKEEKQKREKPYALEGKYCSICGGEISIEFDEDWDSETGFTILPYPYCDNCQKRVFVKNGEN